MVHVTLGRRALLRAAAIVFGRAPPPPDGPDQSVLALHRRRQVVFEMLDEAMSETEVAELGDLCDRLAGEISLLPTTSLAVARIKLAIVLEDYVEPHCVEGFDLRLLRQVETWMRDADEQGLMRARSR